MAHLGHLRWGWRSVLIYSVCIGLFPLNLIMSYSPRYVGISWGCLKKRCKYYMKYEAVYTSSLSTFFQQTQAPTTSAGFLDQFSTLPALQLAISPTLHPSARPGPKLPKHWSKRQKGTGDRYHVSFSKLISRY